MENQTNDRGHADRDEPWPPLPWSLLVPIAFAVAMVVVLAVMFREAPERSWLAFGLALAALAVIVYALFRWVGEKPRKLTVGLLALVVPIAILLGSTVGVTAGAFTRVGGPTRVETAERASLAWSDQGNGYVEVQIDDGDATLASAAACAALRDVPLLIDPRTHDERVKVRQLRVDQVYEAYAGRLGGAGAALRVTDFRGHAVTGDRSCPPLSWSLDQLKSESVVHVACHDWPYLPADLLPLRDGMSCDDKQSHLVLASTAVLQPDPSRATAPDVEVAFVLTAHLNRHHVAAALMALPAYVETDSELEQGLRDRTTPVEGGLVVGGPGATAADVASLTRSLLTEPDKKGALDQLKSLVDSGWEVAALVAAAFGAASVAAATGSHGRTAGGVGFHPPDYSWLARHPVIQWLTEKVPYVRKRPGGRRAEGLAELAQRWLHLGNVNSPPLGIWSTAGAGFIGSGARTERAPKGHWALRVYGVPIPAQSTLSPPPPTRLPGDVYVRRSRIIAQHDTTVAALLPAARDSLVMLMTGSPPPSNAPTTPAPPMPGGGKRVSLTLDTGHVIEGMASAPDSEWEGWLWLTHARVLDGPRGVPAIVPAVLTEPEIAALLAQVVEMDGADPIWASVIDEHSQGGAAAPIVGHLRSRAARFILAAGTELEGVVVDLVQTLEATAYLRLRHLVGPAREPGSDARALVAFEDIVLIHLRDPRQPTGT